MIKILHDVETRDLQPFDVVIRNDEDQTFVSVDSTDPHDTGYVRITWAERAGSRITWETTAQPHNTWPIVVREV